MSTTIRGKYRVQVIENNEVVRDTGEFDNLITDYGLSNVNPFGDVYTSRYLCIGAGVVTEPSVSDVNLGNEVGVSSSGYLATPTLMTASEPWVVRLEMTKDFTGINADISEIGLREYSPSTLISRSLIKDSKGNPVVIFINSNQTLRLTYYGYVSFNDVHDTGSIITSSFGTINYSVERAQKGTTNGWQEGIYVGSIYKPFGPTNYSRNKQCTLCSSATGFNTLGSSANFNVTLDGTIKKLTFTAKWAPTSEDRVVRSIIAGGLVRWAFDSPITILANHDFSIDLELNWGRAA